MANTGNFVFLKVVITFTLGLLVFSPVTANAWQEPKVAGGKSDRLIPIPTARPDVTRALIGDLLPMFSDGVPTEGFVGHRLNYCARYPDDCQSFGLPEDKKILFHLRDDLLQEVIDVNRAVNWRVKYQDDQVQYGESEYWAYPDQDRGDCEDYVLEKRRELRQKGWPAWALLIVQVWATDENGDRQAHAVLSVRFAEGDLILDNVIGDVVPWQYSPHDLVSRQSPAHAGTWEEINDLREPKMFAAIENRA